MGISDLLPKIMISQSGSRYLLTSVIQNFESSSKLNLSSIAYTSTTALAPLQQADTIDLNASEPAVSHICILTFLPLISKVLNLKSTPMVDNKFSENTLSTKRKRRELFPTPELPAIMTLYPQSQSLSIVLDLLQTEQTISPVIFHKILHELSLIRNIRPNKIIQVINTFLHNNLNPQNLNIF